ncbi:hypothetical protein [Roseomonas sp. HF4]|uniref:hypothetical protein n=1 Tax=Roseomonas sp. HF4 TaxID=2562313 RepID=UPI0010C04D35|nr:hypothetical protein [Roseomonas sp. HF4]
MRQGTRDQGEHVPPAPGLEPRHGRGDAAQALTQIHRVGAQDIDRLAEALGQRAQGRGPVLALALRKDAVGLDARQQFRQGGERAILGCGGEVAIR